MKAISIHQPWAWAIVEGHKRVENRSWPTLYRGLLAIHAGRSCESDASGREALAAVGVEVPQDCARGVLLGVVELIDVVRFETLTGGQADEAAHDKYGLVADPLATGPYCWVLRRPHRLERPIPFRGAQRLFELPDHVKMAILEAIGAGGALCR